MKEVSVRLSSARDVQRFVGTLTTLPGEFELVNGQFVLDARSLMGIFGFNLSQPLCLRVYNDKPEILSALKPYMVVWEESHREQ